LGNESARVIFAVQTLPEQDERAHVSRHPQQARGGAQQDPEGEERRSDCHPKLRFRLKTIHLCESSRLISDEQRGWNVEFIVRSHPSSLYLFVERAELLTVETTNDLARSIQERTYGGAGRCICQPLHRSRYLAGGGPPLRTVAVGRAALFVGIWGAVKDEAVLKQWFGPLNQPTPPAVASCL
jgi:hypothetical protein